MSKVVTRIAPSPTGQMHIGTVRTALFNYLFAKHHKGTYFVRIEDTDKERSRSEWTDAIWQDFEWCGITPDEKYIQSEHTERHRELLGKLVESEKAYISREEAKDGSGKMVEVVRLKNPGEQITFNDLIRGEVTFDTTELGDFVIARSINDPLYHFAVVVDDADANVTHVIRAEEHLSNTPRQILIIEALGFKCPLYAHIPLILASDRSKLSKRHGAASLSEYRKQGFLPEALVNYLALLGWNPGDNREIFTMTELIELFTLENVQKGGAIFDVEKLRWINKEHLAKKSDEAFLEYVSEFLPTDNLEEGILSRLLPTLRERTEVGSDLKEAFQEGEYEYLEREPDVEVGMLKWKHDNSVEDVFPRLQRVAELLKNIDEATSPEMVKEVLWSYAEKEGKGEVLWPLRVALTGKERSPDPFTLIYILGITPSIERIEKACAKIAK